MTAPEGRQAGHGDHRPEDGAGHSGGHTGHRGWLMLICCIPMIIAIVAIVLGSR
jgi:hypothetical protein